MKNITKEQVKEIMEASSHQQDVVVGLYKLVMPEWENIKQVHGWPTISGETWEYISREFMEFDRKHHPSVMSGGLWMNNGFSTVKGKDLEFGQVDMSTCEIEMEE